MSSSWYAVNSKKISHKIVAKQMMLFSNQNYFSVEHKQHPEGKFTFLENSRNTLMKWDAELTSHGQGKSKVSPVFIKKWQRYYHSESIISHEKSGKNYNNKNKYNKARNSIFQVRKHPPDTRAGGSARIPVQLKDIFDIQQGLMVKGGAKY